MLSNSYNGCSDGDMQFDKRESVIKVARSCCLEKDTDSEYQHKLINDIQLTHQNYMRIEQDNSTLNFQVDDLDSRLKDQNYQYACLKYELEQLNRQKCDLFSKLNEIPVTPSDKKINVADSSSNIIVIEKRKPSKKSPYHGADLQKLPHIFCLCGVHLKSDQILKDHIRYHKSKAKFVCKTCGVKANGLNLLKHHMKRMHAVEEFSLLKGCRTCGKILNTLKQLHEHRRSEHGRKRKGEIWEQDKSSHINSS